jgi:hypothetical protein
MKKITMLMFVFLTAFMGLFAQTSCLDWNEYVDFKNTAGTGFYTLTGGAEEKAAQTYHYSGPGNVTDIQIDGQIPNGPGGTFSANLRVRIYNVDANNRPTSMIASRNLTWYFWQSNRTVQFGSGGVSVNNDFAVTVELLPNFTGQLFEVQYTGDGEGGSEDLPSIAGPSTGGNWVSLLPAKDGDLYIIPRMNHFITSNFSASATCNVAVSQSVNFTNMTLMTKDRMFNTIGLSGYNGGKTYYSWNFGDGSPVSTQQNPSHAYTTAGVYTVSLTSTIDSWPMGGSSCSDTKTMKISVGLAVTGTPTNLTCNNDNSGAITLLASGGDNNTYSYSVNGSAWQSSATFSGLSAGTYTIRVKDGMGCIANGSNVTITEPTPIVIGSPIGVTSATCGNSDGALLAAASGGTGALTFSIGGPYQSSGAFNNLSSGTYTVSVKDANGCTVSSQVVITNSAAPTLTLQSYTGVSCNGGSDGTITLIGSGGTGALQYSINGINFQSSGSFTGLTAGFYVPTVKDAAGCIGTISCISGPCGVTITEPTQITFSLAQTSTLCSGSSNGQIDVINPIGGLGTLTYSVNGINFQSGTNFTGLSAGLYTVTVKDAAGCSATDTISVIQPNAIVATVGSVNNLSCNGSNDGSFLISATGGTGNYSYSVDGINFYPSGAFNSLSAGTYSITVKDANGCTGVTSVTLTEPTTITATITTGNSTCGNSNGTALITAAGGSGSGYTYSIDGGSTSNSTGSFSGLAAGTYLVLVTDGNGCENVFTVIVTDSNGPTITGNTSTQVSCNGGNDGSITITGTSGGSGTIMYNVDGGLFQLSNVLTGLSAGQHTVVVKDANGCSTSLTITLTEPSPFTIVLTGTNALCNGGNSGSISVSAAGGSGALAYSLDGINFQSATMFNNLGAGTYTVTVRDAGGCTGQATVTITEPTALTIFVSSLNVSCNGGNNGAIVVSASGGTPPYQYNLNGGAFQALGSFTGLSAQAHSVMVKDANGCVLPVNVNITEPADLVLFANITDVSCAGGNNGVIDLSVSGGTAPFTYSWSNNATTEDIFNLVAGNYSVTVTDGNGCSVTNNYPVIQPSNPLIVNGTVTDATGISTNDGAVDITVTGGTPPYSYVWSNGPTTEDITALLPGVYVVIVTDANGCSHTTSYTVNYGVGIDQITNEDGLSIYPNPVKDLLNVQLTANAKAERVTLINLTGETIYEATPNSNKFEVDVKFFAKGVYFINIYVGNDVITKKVVINR